MKIFKLLLVLALGITMTCCSSIKFDKKPPFEVIKSTYTTYDSNSKTINIQYFTQQTIEFDSIYFQSQKVKAKIENIEGSNYVYGKFPSVEKPVMVLDNNPVKELNNPIPQLEKFPFDLKSNEAVISYKVNNNLHFYKIKNVQKLVSY